MRSLEHFIGAHRSERPALPNLGPSVALVAEYVTLEEYGGAGDGIVDCTPAFNAILAAGKGSLRLRSRSVYKFASAVNTIPYQLHIIGDGMSSSVLRFYQATGQCFYLTGTVEAGGVMEGFSIVAAGGATLTAYLYLQAQAAGGSPDFFIGRDLNLTGLTASDMMSYGLLLDGNARTTGLVGLRDVTFENIKIFNTNFRGFETRFAKDLGLHRVSCFATGTAPSNTCAITGSGAGTKSDVVHLSDCALGDLNVDFAANVVGHGNTAGAVTYSVNSSGVNLGGKASSVTNNAGAANRTAGWL